MRRSCVSGAAKNWVHRYFPGEKVRLADGFGFVCGLLLLWLLFVTSQSFAQSSGAEFELTRSTIDNGGGRSEADTFVVTGTTGQHDASRESASSDQFVVTGGFWADGVIQASGDEGLIFRDGFESAGATRQSAQQEEEG